MQGPERSTISRRELSPSIHRGHEICFGVEGARGGASPAALAMTRPEDTQGVSGDRAPLIERVGAFLSPAVFFCAIAAGFLASALAGHLSTRHSMFREFLRISRPIGAETFFNIPAMQIYRLLSEAPPEKILVVLGGSSRFHGAGQTTRGLWSRQLQERLGP